MPEPEARLRLRVGLRAGVGRAQACRRRLERVEGEAGEGPGREGRRLSAAGARDAVGPAREFRGVRAGGGGGGGVRARLSERGGGVGQVLEVGEAVEARCCWVRQEGGGVVGAPCCGVEEVGVCGVEGREGGGGREVGGELGRGAVDGCGELGEVEDVQGAG